MKWSLPKRTLREADNPLGTELNYHTCNTYAVPEERTTPNSEQRIGNWPRKCVLIQNLFQTTDNQKLRTKVYIDITNLT